jgi:hypothetical protein
MSNWLLNLPVLWMAVVIFTCAYLLAALIHWISMSLAVEERARAFKAGLLVGFIASQVWSDFERAKVAVATEASALRTVNTRREPCRRTQARLRSPAHRQCGQSGMASCRSARLSALPSSLAGSARREI